MPEVSNTCASGKRNFLLLWRFRDQVGLRSGIVSFLQDSASGNQVCPQVNVSLCSQARNTNPIDDATPAPQGGVIFCRFGASGAILEHWLTCNMLSHHSNKCSRRSNSRAPGGLGPTMFLGCSPNIACNMGFLPVEKRITQVCPRLPVTRYP